MCSVSEQFKLCSCGELLEEDLKDSLETSYWILYSLDPSKTTIILGLIHSREVFDPLQEKENKRIILKRLNQPNAFDFNPDLFLLGFDLLLAELELPDFELLGHFLKYFFFID
jgi:hypothetical protein